MRHDLKLIALWASCVFLLVLATAAPTAPANAKRIDYGDCVRRTDTGQPPGSPNTNVVSTNGSCPDSARYPVVRDKVDLRAPAFRCFAPHGHTCFFQVSGQLKPVRFFLVRSGKVYHDSLAQVNADTYCACVDVSVPISTCQVPGSSCVGPRVVHQRNNSSHWTPAGQ